MSRTILTKLDSKKFGNIPLEMQQIPKWICCSNDKRPIDPATGIGIKWTEKDKECWFTFPDLIQSYNNSPFAYAIGFVPTLEDDIFGIDLDECLFNDLLSPSAEGIIKLFKPCYIEKSPSGIGLRIIIKADLKTEAMCELVKMSSIPLDAKKTYQKPCNGIGCIEIFKGVGYFTMTGNCSKNSVNILEDKTIQLVRLVQGLEELEKVKKAKSKPFQPLKKVFNESKISNGKEDVALKSISDSNFISMLKTGDDEKIKALINGNITGYGSNSEAWYALLIKLAFWFNGNKARMQSIMEKTKLYEDNPRLAETRTGGRTFLEQEIDKAVSQWEEAGCQAYSSNGQVQVQAQVQAQVQVEKENQTYAIDVNTGDRIPEPETYTETKSIVNVVPEEPPVTSLYDFAMSLPKDYNTRNRYIADGFLPEGITLISSDPKAGKSCFGSQLACSFSTGDKLMERFDMRQTGSVLIFSNEELRESVVGRIYKQLGFEKAMVAMKNIYVHDLSMGIIPLNDEGLKIIKEKYIDCYEIKLVVVDIWDNQRPSVWNKGMNSYTIENLQAKDLKKFAAQNKLSFVIMHHLNKNTQETLAHRISGTAASRGAFDTNFIVSCEDIISKIFSIEIETRITNCSEIQDDRVMVQWTKNHNWSYMGSFKKIIESLTAQHILELYVIFKQSELSNKEILSGLENHYGQRITESSLCYYLSKMIANGMLKKERRGIYRNLVDVTKPEPGQVTTPETKQETNKEPDDDLFSELEHKPETEKETQKETETKTMTETQT